MESLQGQLILDGGKLAGSEFHRTVVLICRHDAEGAFGLVLNRPSQYRVGEVIAATLPEAIEESPLYVGGPVQREFVSCLVQDSAIEMTDEDAVLPGLRLTHTPEEPLGDGPVKFFAGYAGWSAGQLDNELEREAWLVHPATLAWVFDPDAVGLWKKVLRAMGPAYRLLAEMPEDISRN